MKITREFYTSKSELIKKTKFGEAYWREEYKNGMVFGGKRSKPDKHYRFKSKEDFMEYAEKILEKYEEREADKKRRRKESIERKKNEIAELKIGDILYDSWGYDQTNVFFYQVVSKKGQTFTIKEIAKESVEGTSWCSDRVKPVKNAFIEGADEITKRSFNMPIGYLSKTSEDQTHHRSWGH